MQYSIVNAQRLSCFALLISLIYHIQKLSVFPIFDAHDDSIEIE